MDVLVGPLASGGNEFELDLLAYHPASKKIFHIEPSMAPDSCGKGTL